MTYRILQWNVRSYRTNIPFIHAALDNTTPDILCLQETRVPPDFPLPFAVPPSSPF